MKNQNKDERILTKFLQTRIMEEKFPNLANTFESVDRLRSKEEENPVLLTVATIIHDVTNGFDAKDIFSDLISSMQRLQRNQDKRLIK